MRAILLAAGYGTRLRPLTNTIPKCLVPIKGKPLLEIWLDRLTNAGLGPFLINTHYLPEQVEEFVSKSSYRDQIILSHESELLGTAGTLVKNLDFFQSQDGLLIHADNYCLADLKAFVEVHAQRSKECLMTMMTFRTDSPQSCGIVEIDERGVVIGFHEKVENPPGNLANGAVYVLSGKLTNGIKKDSKDFSLEVLPKLMGQIQTFESTELFLDIGKPETYHRVVGEKCLS